MNEDLTKLTPAELEAARDNAAKDFDAARVRVRALQAEIDRRALDAKAEKQVAGMSKAEREAFSRKLAATQETEK